MGSATSHVHVMTGTPQCVFLDSSVCVFFFSKCVYWFFFFSPSFQGRTSYKYSKHKKQAT